MTIVARIQCLVTSGENDSGFAAIGRNRIAYRRIWVSPLGVLPESSLANLSGSLKE
jgi:hypothetical protein